MLLTATDLEGIHTSGEQTANSNGRVNEAQSETDRPDAVTENTPLLPRKLYVGLS